MGLGSSALGLGSDGCALLLHRIRPMEQIKTEMMIQRIARGQDDKGGAKLLTADKGLGMGK